MGENILTSEEFATVIKEWVAADREFYLAHGVLPMVEFSRSVRLPKPPSGWFDLSYAVTLSGALAIMRANVDVKSIWLRIRMRRGARRELKLPPDARASLSVFDGVSETAWAEFPLMYPFPHFDRLADGSWIVADNMAEPDEANATQLEPDGKVRQHLCLGTGIERLQADPAEGFWIGYRDNGIHDAVHDVESGGVVRFDDDGQPNWSMNDTEGCRIPWVDHAYALNISAAGRWTYTYTNFLLTRVDASTGPRVLRPLVEFADAFAISGDRILLAGMYFAPRDKRGFDRIVMLGPPGRWTPHRPRREWTAIVHRAINPKEHMWVGRGDTLHCVRGRTWHRLSVDEADRAVPPGPWRPE